MTPRPSTPVFALVVQDLRAELAALAQRVNALQALVDELAAQRRDELERRGRES